MSKRKYIKLLLKFRYAIRGLKFVWTTQKSFRIQCIIGLIVNILLRQPNILIISIIVLSFEIINTAIERLCDFINPRYNKAIEIVKDISAGAVALSCIGAIVVGITEMIKFIS